MTFDQVADAAPFVPGPAGRVGADGAGAARLCGQLLKETGRDYFVHALAGGRRPADGGAGRRARSPRPLDDGIERRRGGERAAPDGQRTYCKRAARSPVAWRDATGPVPEAVEVDFTLSIMNPGSDKSTWSSPVPTSTASGRPQTRSTGGSGSTPASTR